MANISSSIPQQWQLKPTGKPEKQKPSDFDLQNVEGSKPSKKPVDLEKLMGPVDTLPKDNVDTEKFRIKKFDKEFKMPTLESDVKKFVGDLDKGEKALLGGALAAGGLAAGNLKVKIPLSDQSSLNIGVRTRSNKAAREAADNPASLMFPDAKQPKNPGINIGVKAKF